MPAPRTLQRILGEALLVLLIAALVLGLAWETGFPDLGWILALIIAAAGTPLLEILRLRNP
jgi:uncharacterized membrane protein YccC